MNIFSFVLLYFSLHHSQGRIERVTENLVSLASGRVKQSQRCQSAAGYRADPVNCHLFYHCGRGTPISCGILMFNDITKTCDWPTRVMQLRPECSDSYKLRRNAKTEDQMGRLDEGEIMRHLGGDIATNVIRQETLKGGLNQRFDFRGKAVSDNQPMIRIRKHKYEKRKMAPRRVRMLRRRLVKKNPGQGNQNGQKKILRKQIVNIAQNPQNNEHKILREKTTEDDVHEKSPEHSVQQLLQPSQERLHRFDDSLKQVTRNKINRFGDSKQQIQPQHRISQNRFHDLMQEITLKQPRFSSHTPMTVSMNKHDEVPSKRIRIKSPQTTRKTETNTEELLKDGDSMDWLQNKIFNATETTNDITEVFKEEPRVGVIHDQPRIRLERPNDYSQQIPIRRIVGKKLRKGSKPRIFTPNFNILAKKSTTQRFTEQPTAPRFTSIEQTTSQRFDNIEKTTSPPASNVQTTASMFTNIEKPTAPTFTRNVQTASRFASKKQTTAPRSVIIEQTTNPWFSSNGQTIAPRFASNKQTTAPRFASNIQPTASRFASNIQPTAQRFASNEQTTAPRFASNEQPITLNEAFQQRSGQRIPADTQRIHSNVQVSTQPFGLKMKTRKYMETDNIREKEESNIKEQDENSFKAGREIEVNTQEKELKTVKYVDYNKKKEDAIKIREEISNEIRKMLEKAKVTAGTQDNISSCITYYLTCKSSSKNKGQCLKEFNSCSGAQILLPDLYSNVI